MCEKTAAKGVAALSALVWPTFVSLRLLHIFHKPQQGIMLALPQAQLQPAHNVTSGTPNKSVTFCIPMGYRSLRSDRTQVLQHEVDTRRRDRLQYTSAFNAASRAFFFSCVAMAVDLLRSRLQIKA